MGRRDSTSSSPSGSPPITQRRTALLRAIKNRAIQRLRTSAAQEASPSPSPRRASNITPKGIRKRTVPPTPSTVSRAAAAFSQPVGAEDPDAATAKKLLFDEYNIDSELEVPDKLEADLKDMERSKQYARMGRGILYGLRRDGQELVMVDDNELQPLPQMDELTSGFTPGMHPLVAVVKRLGHFAETLRNLHAPCCLVPAWQAHIWEISVRDLHSVLQGQCTLSEVEGACFFLYPLHRRVGSVYKSTCMVKSYTEASMAKYVRVPTGKRPGTVYEYVHRLVHWCYVGPFKEGHECLHLCDRRACISPKHLFADDHKTNKLGVIAYPGVINRHPNRAGDAERRLPGDLPFKPPR